MIRLISIYIFLVSALLSNSPNSISEGTFLQQQRIFFNLDNGLPSNNIRDIVSTNDGTIFAATDKGVIIYSNKEWITIDDISVSSRIIYEDIKNGHKLTCKLDKIKINSINQDILNLINIGFKIEN